MNNLHFSPYTIAPRDKNEIKTHSLYPYRSIKLAVIFVYGTEFHRRIHIMNISATVKIAAIFIILFMGLAAFILRKMRSNFNLRRADFSSAFIDILIVFIACGNLRMRHNLERWFFGILLIGALFMTPIFTSELLNQVYRMQDQKITTFEQLARIRAPIYINPALAMHAETIREQLRFEYRMLTQHHNLMTLNFELLAKK